jgi:hypothetical protein
MSEDRRLQPRPIGGIEIFRCAKIGGQPCHPSSQGIMPVSLRLPVPDLADAD